ncbi:MAG: protein adenylyltransferase SelO family protein [Vicinamibacterales bacterium]
MTTPIPAPDAAGWRLDHTYAALPPLFHARVAPTPVRQPEFVVLNAPLATALGLDPEALESGDGAAVFAGNRLPDGAQPLAQAYAGHQFGFFTGLGDGRAILLGEQVTPDGGRVDVQLKGAGPTPYSRRGDGRAALGPMLRELVIGEAMHALGIPTSRGLAVVSTGEPVYRERPLPGAVLPRVASSHLRVGTFEWAYAHRDTPRSSRSPTTPSAATIRTWPVTTRRASPLLRGESPSARRACWRGGSSWASCTG